ncbi:metallophosphoesterase [Halostella sp. JP-L12]|uniref:metallophosphoesterase n=1 Tax=Halostella TaxID=1843185 RepID=UPI000EF7AAA8|nr:MULTISPECIES: metallophosphoesterase [Halostella]NHN47600.1 metallophosphoesterase [Halostella sp. JP-L12]
MRLRDRACFLPAADALVLSDLHVGKAAASNVEFPLGERTDLSERLAVLIDEFDPAEVVLAGDLLEAFDYVPHGVEETVDRLAATVRDAGADLVVTPGNHDGLLDAVYDGSAPAEHRLADGETVVCHGHEAPETDADRYVVGHDHPAIEIEGKKRPCYLVGPGVYCGADVVMLPAFTRLAAGVTVNGMRASDFASPLVTDPDAFRPVVWDEDAGEPLEFPPLGELRSFL